MHSLTSQLEYNWERGFYSVVQDSTKRYSLFTTKDEQGGIIHSPFFYLKEDCLTNLGTMGSMIDEELVKSWEWQIVDTIHPLELMGKGFQVGDKVCFNINRLKGKTGLIVGDNEGTFPASYNILIGDDAEWLLGQYLKPVLPVEEDICKDCKKVIEKGTCQLTNQCHVCEVMEYQAKKKECVHRFEFFEVKPLVKTIIGDIESCTRRIYSCVNCGLVTSKDPNE